MKLHPIRSAFTLAACLLLASAAHANQKTNPSRVYGKILISDGSPAVGVVIKMTQLGSAKKGGIGGGNRNGLGTPQPIQLKTVLSTKTDSNGVFEFKAVPPGQYEFEAGNARTIGYGFAMVVVDGQGNALEQNVTLEAPVRD